MITINVNFITDQKGIEQAQKGKKIFNENQVVARSVRVLNVESYYESPMIPGKTVINFISGRQWLCDESLIELDEKFINGEMLMLLQSTCRN